MESHEERKKAYHLVLVYSYGAGFFSLFNKLFGYLEKYNPIFAVSWQVYNPFEAYGEGEIFGKVFAPYVNQEYQDFEIETIVCHKYVDETYTGRKAGFLYSEKECLENQIPLDWRRRLNDFCRKFYRIHNQKIIEKYLRFTEEMNQYRSQSKKILTFLVRHPALEKEQEKNILPSYELYEREILEVGGGNLENLVLVCLTDSQEAFHHFSKKYEGRILKFPEVERRWSHETDSAYTAGGDEKIEMAMLSVLYLCGGDIFLHPISNMATAVLALNPEIEHRYLVGS